MLYFEVRRQTYFYFMVTIGIRINRNGGGGNIYLSTYLSHHPLKMNPEISA